MNLVAIRGAITVEADTRDAILESTTQVLKAILTQNQLKIEDILQITFTATKDLSAAYPAVAARELGITSVSLMCMQEMDVVGSLTKCIRLSVLAYSDILSQDTVTHCYLKGAASLRPDLLRN